VTILTCGGKPPRRGRVLRRSLERGGKKKGGVTGCRGEDVGLGPTQLEGEQGVQTRREVRGTPTRLNWTSFSHGGNGPIGAQPVAGGQQGQGEGGCKVTVEIWFLTKTCDGKMGDEGMRGKKTVLSASKISRHRVVLTTKDVGGITKNSRGSRKGGKRDWGLDSGKWAIWSL